MDSIPPILMNVIKAAGAWGFREETALAELHLTHPKALEQILPT